MSVEHKEKKKKGDESLSKYEAVKWLFVIMALSLGVVYAVWYWQQSSLADEELRELQAAAESYGREYPDAQELFQEILDTGLYNELKEVLDGVWYTDQALTLTDFSPATILQNRERYLLLDSSNYLATYYVAEDQYLLVPSLEGEQDIALIEEVLRIQEQYPQNALIADMSIEHQARLEEISRHTFSALLGDMQVTRERNQSRLVSLYGSIVVNNPELLQLNIEIDEAQEGYLALEMPTTERLQAVYAFLSRHVNNLNIIRMAPEGSSYDELSEWVEADTYYRYDNTTYGAFSVDMTESTSIQSGHDAQIILSGDELAYVEIMAQLTDLRNNLEAENRNFFLSTLAFLGALMAVVKAQAIVSGVRSLTQKGQKQEVQEEQKDDQLLDAARFNIKDGRLVDPSLVSPIEHNNEEESSQ